MAVVNSTISTLIRCQINTPFKILNFFSKLLGQHRENLGKVIDLGAGDGRFALIGDYQSYEGYEIDDTCKLLSNLPENSTISHECAFSDIEGNYDTCIGNPPFIRHHDLNKDWLLWLQSAFFNNYNLSLSLQANLFVYFMALGICKTSDEGIIAQIVPYEWISRPSVKGLRDYIRVNNWDVSVYRLWDGVFPKVLTTSSITIIDKSKKNSTWRYYNVTPSFKVNQLNGKCGIHNKVIPYANRGAIWAMRGLSPGTQKIFTLTEGERIHHGISFKDVVPCVTSLRTFPGNLKTLDNQSFKSHLVETGRKCWLIRSDRNLSKDLKLYLEHIPKSLHDTSTCNSRDPWYRYKFPPIPIIIYSSGFTEYGPKILHNEIGAIAIGSAHGIHSEEKVDSNQLISYLRDINFENSIIPHAHTLKKVEVRQMNYLLNNYLKREHYCA